LNKKSKAVAFILSFLPGLSHVYLGNLDRAFIFFLLFFGAIIGAFGMTFISGSEIFVYGLGIALPIIWLVALVDAISLVDKVGYEKSIDVENGACGNDMGVSNQKLIAVMLSVVPGAGHMYLGLMSEGLFFMSAFFLTIFLMSWLNLSFFLFLLPIIWFYSLFDALHITEDEKPRSDVESYIVSWIEDNPKIIGWSLITLGCLVLVEQIILPLLTWKIGKNIKTGTVALIFILSGLRLIRGPKGILEEDSVEHENQELMVLEEEEQE